MSNDTVKLFDALSFEYEVDSMLLDWMLKYDVTTFSEDVRCVPEASIIEVLEMVLINEGASCFLNGRKVDVNRIRALLERRLPNVTEYEDLMKQVEMLTINLIGTKGGVVVLYFVHSQQWGVTIPTINEE